MKYLWKCETKTTWVLTITAFSHVSDTHTKSPLILWQICSFSVHKFCCFWGGFLQQNSLDENKNQLICKHWSLVTITSLVCFTWNGLYLYLRCIKFVFLTKTLKWYMYKAQSALASDQNKHIVCKCTWTFFNPWFSYYFLIVKIHAMKYE